MLVQILLVLCVVLLCVAIGLLLWVVRRQNLQNSKMSDDLRSNRAGHDDAGEVLWSRDGAHGPAGMSRRKFIPNIVMGSFVVLLFRMVARGMETDWRHSLKSDPHDQAPHSDSAVRQGQQAPHNDSAVRADQAPHSDSAVRRGDQAPHSDSAVRADQAPHSDSAVRRGDQAPHSDSAVRADQAPHSDSAVRRGDQAPHSDSAVRRGDQAPHSDSAVARNRGDQAPHSDSV